MLKECNMEQEVMTLFCDNLSAIKSRDITPHEDKDTDVIGLGEEQGFTDISGKTMLLAEEDGSPHDAETFTIRLKPRISVEYLPFSNLMRRIKENNVSNNKDNNSVTEDIMLK